jgi:pimeloyl-ACP methyl ester carboxylesterase
MEGVKPEEENIKKDPFEEKWSHPDYIKVWGEEIFKVHDISPEEGKSKTKTPLVVGLGWGEIPESGKEHIKYWTEHGRRVIVPDTPHGILAGEKEGYPNIELEKMAALVETLRAKGIEIKEDGIASGQADLMGRSEGAIFSVMLAYLYPQLVHNLVLENPAGLTGKINKGIFAMRWLKLMKQQILKEYKETGIQPEDHLSEALSRNLPKAIESVLAISGADVREMLKEIKANGIGVSVIYTTADKFFPMEKITGNFEEEPQGKFRFVQELTEEHVDYFYPVEGSHNSYFYEPEKFAGVVNRALDDLEEKKKKEKDSKAS